MSTQVVTMEFRPEGLVVSYVRVPDDLRKNGLEWHHQVLVPFGSDYDDEVEAVVDAIAALMDDVLEDESTAEPIEPDQDQDGDDDDDDE